MNYLKQFTTFLITVFLFPGCAIHTPMSEMLMFQEKKVDGKVYSAEEGYGAISGTLDLTSKQIKQYLCGSTDSGCIAGREPSVNVHSIIATDSMNQYAVSVALGVPLVGGRCYHKYPR